MSDEKPGKERPRRSAGSDNGDWTSTRELLKRHKEGDEEALNRLLARYLPMLKKWASQRLPSWARDGKDTDDLIQETCKNTLRRIDEFEPRHEGAFYAYLRQGIINHIKTLKKFAVNRPGREELASDHADQARSPLDAAIDSENFERYERGLQKLSTEERELIILKFEYGFSHSQIAQIMNRPTPNAARMAVTRALERLVREMGDGE